MGPRHLARLTTVVALVVCACDRTDKSAAVTAVGGTTAAQTKLSLDESKLPDLMHFSTTDLDKSKDPCVDFNGHVNAKWVAANPIPGDRSSWGPPEVMRERSLAVQRQIAEQLAAKINASGIDKIIGDFWATGMDEAKVNAAGLDPLKSRLGEIDALTDPASLAAYLRTTAARGEGSVFAFFPMPDYKNSSVNMAVVVQAGLGFDDRGYYFDADKQDKLRAYQAHVARLLELAGVPAGAAAA